MWTPLLLLALAPAALPPQTGTSRIQLEMAQCGPEDEPALRRITRENTRFDVVERYGEPLIVVRLRSRQTTDGCVDGPGEAEVEVGLTEYPRDGGKPHDLPGLTVEGHDPRLVDALDWSLIDVPLAGCCGAEDGHVWIDPRRGVQVALSSLPPLPLQVINRESPQGSVWRFVFALSGLSVRSPADSPWIAELTLAGLDGSAAQRYGLSYVGDAEGAEGGWSVQALRYAAGPGFVDDMPRETWWVDGPIPTAEQVDGMTLEVDLQCQCELPPRTLKIPLRKGKLDVARASGAPGIKVKVL